MGYEFDWGLPFRQPYRDWLLHGLALTAVLTVVSSIGSLILGVLAAIARVSSVKAYRLISIVFIEVFRNIPTLFWLLFFFYVAPSLPGGWLSTWLNRWPGLPLAAALLALSTSNGAHIAEILRSGIQSLPKAQQNAGLSLGLHPARVCVSIVLPQAMHVSMSVLGPRMVHNFHNTSLALVVSVPELVWQTQQIESVTFRGFEAVTVATLMFVAMSLVMTLAFRLLEQRSSRWRPKST